MAARGMKPIQAHVEAMIMLDSQLELIAALVEVDSAKTQSVLILSEMVAHGMMIIQQAAVLTTMNSSLLQPIAALAELLHFNYSP